MPTPRSGESEADFVSRCIPIVIEEGTAANPEQAAAICHSMYSQSKDNRDYTGLCVEPDIDEPKLKCGHPLPCPRHKGVFHGTIFKDPPKVAIRKIRT